jgi:hypothetical protein
MVLAVSLFVYAQDKEQKQTDWVIEKVSSSLAHDLSGLFEGHGGGQGGIAKWPIKNHNLEEVYNALMQNLMMMSRTTAEGDLASGTITAHRPGALIKFIIIPKESDVDLIGKWEFVPGEKVQLSTPFSQAKKFFNEFFSKVKETLK